MAEFVHLHNHSDFSLLHASSTVHGLITKVRSMNMPAVALTDDGNMFGALRFYKECMAKKDKDDQPLSPLKPIVGCDFFMAPGSRLDKVAGENAKRYSRIVLLARNETGYRNLCKLSSSGYTEGFYYRPRIDKEVLKTYASDLIALSGGIGGEIPQLITRNRMDEAKAAAAWYKDLFGPEHYFLELSDHGIPEQKIINKGLLDLSKELGIPVVAANDTYYLSKEDSVAHDILLCIGNKNKRTDVGRHRFSSQEFYVKTPEEMAALFGHIDGALQNTLRIAEMCELKITLPGPLLPDYEIPESFRSQSAELVSGDIERLRQRFKDEKPEIVNRLDEPLTQYFVYEANKGLRKRYGENPDQKLIERMDYELYIIIKMGFIGYFLIVWDFIAWSKAHGIPVGPGRGSGAGSIVAYSLTITDIEPIRYHLLFERFLNPERVSMPDFDVDFCFERRQEVIDYVTKRYGEKKVGQIITFGTLKTKAVLKDVARALDISFEEANQIVKHIPDGPTAAKLHLKDLLAPTLGQKWVDQGYQPNADAIKALYNQGGIYKELFDIASKLEGLNRHASTHAAGVVIGKEELTTYVPLFRDSKTGAISTQYTMDQLEECGLVKMDFLGLKTLTLLKNTAELIRSTSNPDFDLNEVSETDARTFKMLGEGKSAAVFQFDGDGMQRTLSDAKPTCIEDLIALNALYRPGPLEYIPQFVACKWGRQDISYPHKSLEGILKETYGVMVYQEQVMQAAQIVGGYSLGGADLLRRAMSKKKTEEMAKHRAIFAQGAAKLHGLTQAQSDEIFKILEKFAGYGFNKSHAAAYSVLAYKTAFLKANYPAEFMAANLTNEINSPDDFTQYLAETRAMGILVDAPDINRSQKFFTVIDGHIVFGLMGIKGIGSSVVDEITQARKAGPFKSVVEFLERVDLHTVNRKAVEVLVLAGAFGSLCPKRKPVIDALERLFDQASSKKDDAVVGQTSLFDNATEEFPPIELEGEEYDLLELLKHEKDILGSYFSGNPLDKYRGEWERSTTLDLSRAAAASSDRTYHVVAMLSALRFIVTKKGSRMGFATFEDYNGSIECVMFSESLSQFQDKLILDSVLGLTGTVDLSRDQPQLVLKEISAPADLPEKDAGEVHVRIPILPADEREVEKQLMSLRGIMLDHSGRCPVYLHFGLSANEKILRVSGQMAIRSMPEVLRHLREQSGVSEVWKIYPAMGKVTPKTRTFAQAPVEDNSTDFLMSEADDNDAETETAVNHDLMERSLI